MVPPRRNPTASAYPLPALQRLLYDLEAGIDVQVPQTTATIERRSGRIRVVLGVSRQQQVWSCCSVGRLRRGNWRLLRRQRWILSRLSGTGEAADSVEIGRVTPIARPNREATRPQPSGNPLWSIPLSSLSATQGRPIFSASRRPMQRAVVAPPVEQVAGPDASGRTGTPDADRGCRRRRRGDCRLSRPDQPKDRPFAAGRNPCGMGAAIGGGARSYPQEGRPDRNARNPASGNAGTKRCRSDTGVGCGASGGFDTPYVPFIPRSTPKNGESDGL